MVEAMRHAYLDRNTYLGDPAFVDNPLQRLLSKDYAGAIRATIAPDRATPSKDAGAWRGTAREARDDALFDRGPGTATRSRSPTPSTGCSAPA